MQIAPLVDIDIRRADGAWPLSPALRAGVEAHWQQALDRNPHLWDGRILGFSAPGGGMPSVVDGVFRAEAQEDAYSAFMYWRDSGFPDIGMAHVFGTALIVSGDDALILGVMGDRTANAGRIYPPGGSLEPRDVQADGRVDVVGCINIELEEETGLKPEDARIGGLFAVTDGPRVSLSRVFHFEQPADVLVSRIRANLAVQEEQELADVVAVRNAGEASAINALPYAVAVAEALAEGRLS